MNLGDDLKNKMMKLRSETNASLMVCKNALNDSKGDFDKALLVIKNDIGSKAYKKADRVTKESFFVVRNDKNRALVISFAAETDFVIKNNMFQNFCAKLADFAFDNFEKFNTIEELFNLNFSDENDSVKQALDSFIGVIGENIRILSIDKKVDFENAIVVYVHGESWLLKNSGKIVVLLSVSNNEIDREDVKLLTEQIAMQICAMDPRYLSIVDVDEVIIEDQKKNFYEQVRKNNQKPDFVIEKIVNGKLDKFFQEIVLFEQVFILQEPGKKQSLFVKDLIDRVNKKLSSPIIFSWFKRYS